ncbi:MAG: hypothetical protein AAFP84_15955, partial [Actinomycetota bacterium]
MSARRSVTATVAAALIVAACSGSDGAGSDATVTEPPIADEGVGAATDSETRAETDGDEVDPALDPVTAADAALREPRPRFRYPEPPPAPAVGLANPDAESPVDRRVLILEEGEPS